MTISFLGFLTFYIASKIFGQYCVGGLIWLGGLFACITISLGDTLCYIGLSVALDYVLGIAIGLFVLIWQSLFDNDNNNERIVR